MARYDGVRAGLESPLFRYCSMRASGDRAMGDFRGGIAAHVLRVEFYEVS